MVVVKPPHKTALIGATRTGKTLFAVRNSPAGIYAIDPEQAIAHYSDVASGAIFWPTVQGRIDPLTIAQEAEAKLWDLPLDTTIIVDSVTSIYRRQSRLASMAGDLTAAQREARGLSKNKATLMKGKANAIQVLGGMASYGKPLFLIWHEGAGLDVDSFKMVTKESISNKERGVLLRDIDVILRFDTNGGNRYTVTVDPETRGRGIKKPRTGFTIVDPPSNFWAGAMDKLDDLIYRHFTSEDDAIQWAEEKSSLDPEFLQAHYAEVREERKPANASAMWFEWMTAIYAIIESGNGPVPSKNERPAEDPVPPPVPPPADPEPTEVPIPDPEPEKEKEVSPVEAQVEAVQAQVVAALDDAQQEDSGPGRVYDDRHRTAVAPEDFEDYDIYLAVVGKLPYERSNIYNAKDVHGANWRLPDEEE
jgi:hypothetical protein